jgi:oligopeptide transport system permease protein
MSAEAGPGVEAIPNFAARAPSPLRRAAAALARRRGALAAVVGLGILGIAAAAAPALAARGPAAIDLALGATPPSLEHWFGTDALGRDLFLRVLDGARVSLGVALIATFVSLGIGVPYGAVAGSAGGRVDALLMRGVDVLYGMPSILFVLLLLSWFGGNPAWTLPLLFVGLGAISWLTTSRIVRAQVLSLRSREFIDAARLAGASEASVIFRHLVPQTTGPVLAYATLTIPRVMIEEAFLSFLGLGVSAPRSSWGTLLYDGMQSFRETPWLVLFPGLALAATLVAFYAIGDALRDALDPKETRR